MCNKEQQRKKKGPRGRWVKWQFMNEEIEMFSTSLTFKQHNIVFSDTDKDLKRH